MWRSKRVVRAIDGGGVACGAATGVASASGLKAVVEDTRPVSFSM
jgi:hypothetical protein